MCNRLAFKNVEIHYFIFEKKKKKNVKFLPCLWKTSAMIFLSCAGCFKKEYNHIYALDHGWNIRNI